MPQRALRRPFGERHLAHQLRGRPVRHDWRGAARSPTALAKVRRRSGKWVGSSFDLAQPRMELACDLLCETGADLAGEDPVTPRSWRASHTENERAHLVLGSLAQDEPAHHELLPMDCLGFEPIGRPAWAVGRAPLLRDDSFET